jgi:hypothetical protein
MGYGLAGGGMGPYKICENMINGVQCATVYDKEQERPSISDKQIVTFTYQNHRDETVMRTAFPIAIEWKKTKWHPIEQWILEAWDMDKDAMRSFAMEDIREWTTRK